MASIKQIQNHIKTACIIALSLCGFYFLFGINHYGLNVVYSIVPIAFIVVFYDAFLLYKSQKGNIKKSLILICITICVIIILWCVLVFLSFFHLLIKGNLEILETIGMVNYTYYLLMFIINFYIMKQLTSLHKMSKSK